MDLIFGASSSGNAALVSSLATIACWWIARGGSTRRDTTNGNDKQTMLKEKPAVQKTPSYALLPCIRNRRSVFPKDFKANAPTLDPAIVASLLEAALWAPFHGKCYQDQRHPARFVVLGKQSMRDMQRLTLCYYDEHWKSCSSWDSFEEYQNWRQRTEEEIEGRWGPVDYMIAVTVKGKTGPRDFPEWEQAAAVACAVQNMHLQSTQFPQLACYWSSWHDEARDSDATKEFLNMEANDKCLGFFIVAQHKRPHVKDRRQRDPSLMAQEWRP